MTYVPILGALFLAGCMPSIPSKTLALEIGSDAAALRALCSVKQRIDPAQWPVSFKRNGVESVYVGHNGLYIETDRVYVQEAGVFLPCDGSRFVPPVGDDPAYKQVADGIYTYYIAG
jgi:hypothetical protein